MKPVLTCPAILLVLALVIGQLTAVLLYYAYSAKRREQRTRSLYDMSRELSGALSVEQTVDICQRFIKHGFDAAAVVWLPRENGHLQLATGLADLASVDASIAQWSFEHGQVAGLGTGTLPAAQALYVPLKAPTRLCGVLVLVPTGALSAEQQQWLDTCATLIAITLERIHCVILARDAQVSMTAERLRHTLLQQAKEQAEQVAKAKSTFLATMSHEIRTPLHAILGMLELLHEAPLADHQREQVHIAFAASRGLLALINEILDYSKMEAGAFTLDQVDFNLRTLMNEVALVMTPLAQQKKIELRIVLPTEQHTAVSGDPNCLRAILVNLLNNAIKFTPEGGLVTCHGGPVGRNETGLIEWRFEVRDTGIGIAEAQRTAIFAPFLQGDKTTTRQYGGTGLGLAITQRFIHMMGGDIQVEANSHAASGSAFYFTIRLLLRAEAATLGEPERLADGTPPVQPAYAADILVVDDQTVNLKVTCAMLVNQGCDPKRIVTATNGQQAVEQFQNGRFHLVLMDCQMPVMDGCQATGAIRAWERHHGQALVPVVAFTADVTTESRHRIQVAEMSDCLTKPITLADLRAILRKHIAHTDTATPSHSNKVT
ncbi:MAG: response regulator [Magnetococcales bacterium]|nr:response regulator [Magnetococcales bacterium]